MRVILILACAYATAFLNLGDTSFADEVDSTPSSDCSPINLNVPGGTMRAVVARTPKIMQSGGVCTFHVAAEMYDAWRDRYHNSPVTSTTSPLAVAMQNSLHDSNVNFENGGDAADNLQDILKYGACPRRNYNPITGQDMDEYFFNEVSERFESLSEEYRAYVLNFTKQPPELWDLTGQIRSMVLNFAAKYPGYPLRANIDFVKLQTYFLMSDFVNFMNEMIPMNCAAADRLWPSHAFKVANYTDVKMNNNAGKLSLINQYLSLGDTVAQPIGIAYCSDVLDDGRAYKPRDFTAANCGRHESLIIGRRTNPKNGVCQFLVRNSWGRHSPYHRDWEKVLPLDHVWVDANVLVTSINEITQLQ